MQYVSYFLQMPKSSTILLLELKDVSCFYVYCKFHERNSGTNENTDFKEYHVSRCLSVLNL
jgi:hypothetical protein